VARAHRPPVPRDERSPRESTGGTARRDKKRSRRSPEAIGRIVRDGGIAYKARRFWALRGDVNMAEHGAVEIGTATGVDYNTHLAMYERFIGMTKWVTGAIVILLILMAFFLL